MCYALYVQKQKCVNNSLWFHEDSVQNYLAGGTGFLESAKLPGNQRSLREAPSRKCYWPRNAQCTTPSYVLAKLARLFMPQKGPNNTTCIIQQPLVRQLILIIMKIFNWWIDGWIVAHEAAVNVHCIVAITVAACSIYQMERTGEHQCVRECVRTACYSGCDTATLRQKCVFVSALIILL